VNEWLVACYNFASCDRYIDYVADGASSAETEEGREPRRKRLPRLFHNGRSFFAHRFRDDDSALFCGIAV